MEFSIKTRVYLEDTDAQGIVYYVNYLKFMERARTEFMRLYGYDFQRLAEQDGHFVVHGMSVQYLKPARMDDDLRVTVTIRKLARTYIVFAQEVMRADDVLCKADIKVACIGAANSRPMAIPANIVNNLNNPAPISKHLT